MLIFALALAALASLGRAEEPKRVVSVPIEILPSKHIALKAKINGKGPYRLIFDTGAPFSIVNNRTARDSGMIAKKAAVPFLALFNSLGAVKINSIEVGEVKIEHTDAAVMDHPTVELIGKVVGPIDGLIGFPFFARFRMVIDYQARRMSFVPSGYTAPGTEGVIESLVESLSENTPGPRVVSAPAQWGMVPVKEKNDHEAGVTVKEVLPGGACAAAGMRAGDRLLTIDGRWTDSVADTFEAAGHVKPGHTTKAVIQRGPKRYLLTITPRTGI